MQFCYLLQEKKSKSGAAFFCQNYDEVVSSSLQLSRPQRETIIAFQKQVRMWN